MRHPGAPTEALFLADCVAGRSLTGPLDAVDRLPVCTVVGASLRPCYVRAVARMTKE